MSDYQHANASELQNTFPEAYFPSMMVDFTECKDMAKHFAEGYGNDGVIYKVNFSRVAEALNFRPRGTDLFDALSRYEYTKTSELNLNFLGVVHYLESNRVCKERKSDKYILALENIKVRNRCCLSERFYFRNAQS